MFVINSESNSKLAKVIAIVFALSAIIGLFVQVVSLLAMTKSKIGKRIRKGVIGTLYDCMDESIDEAAIRAPQWMAKLEKLGNLDQ